jgi:hypothetical protein
MKSLFAVAIGLIALPAAAQSFGTDDPVLRAIWAEGMTRSQAEPLMQALLDSIGPRLTGSPGQRAANDWAVARYTAWGVPARNEQYGTWRGWRRGITHVDLIAPRVRTLEATMMAWSPGTPRGRPVEGPVVLLPDLPDSAAYAQWMRSVRGAFVGISYPEPTCRPQENWATWAGAQAATALFRERQQASQAWNARLGRTGYDLRTLPVALEQAGAAGVLSSRWSLGWGVNKVFNARTLRVPQLDVGCEDYGLLARLAGRDQGPRLRVAAEAEDLGEVPVFNTIAEVRGDALPDEYVLLSAHFDSWDAGSGATDNGTGTIVMMEAMRILRAVYPDPRRTILVGHWSGEEQGLNGSRAFAHDHPEVVAGLQALFNQDNGTGEIARISMQGLVGAGAHFARWFAGLPPELTRDIGMTIPGTPGGGGSDYASFICAGAPAFGLGSASWDYGTYTWHTNRDTYDKVSLDNVRRNAVLTAMLVYLASEDPDRVPRDRRVLPVNQRGEQMTWPECRDGVRRSQDSTR